MSVSLLPSVSRSLHSSWSSLSWAGFSQLDVNCNRHCAGTQCHRNWNFCLRFCHRGGRRFYRRKPRIRERRTSGMHCEWLSFKMSDFSFESIPAYRPVSPVRNLRCYRRTAICRLLRTHRNHLLIIHYSEKVKCREKRFCLCPDLVSSHDVVGNKPSHRVSPVRSSCLTAVVYFIASCDLNLDSPLHGQLADPCWMRYIYLQQFALFWLVLIWVLFNNHSVGDFTCTVEYSMYIIICSIRMFWFRERVKGNLGLHLLDV